MAAALASPDREICGLLLGRLDRVDAIIPASNVAADPARRFEIDPGVLLAAHRAARNGGPVPIGCYHSHPGGSALPSATDAEAAEPGSLWLIVGVGPIVDVAGGDAATRLWLAEPDGFREVLLRKA